MKKYFKNILFVVMICGGIALAGGFIYGCYWVAKTTSYSFFYEDMVIKTIHQQVKPEYLK
jgi:hypothetical protein